MVSFRLHIFMLILYVLGREREHGGPTLLPKRSFDIDMTTKIFFFKKKSFNEDAIRPST